MNTIAVFTAAASVLALVACSPASARTAAQPGSDTSSSTVSSQPVPDTAAQAAGVPSDQAVNPAPGARGPYVGDGANAFYDVDARISAVGQEITALPSSQRRKAASALKSIKAEEATQIHRHGELRDWDRENLNHRLDQLAQQYPILGAGTPAPIR